MSFNSLGLSDALLKAISKKGYTTPSPIQAKAIPHVLAGKDLLASAQTGTGKTAGFTLPMLQLLAEKPPLRNRPIRALILTPTRELAAQIYDNILAYGSFLDIRSTVIFGGVNQNPQVKILQRGVDILVATPGRLLDLKNQKLLFLDKVEFLVLDEADRMLDMGFIRDIRKIIGCLPKERQNLLFSATISDEIKELSSTILRNPVMVETTPEVTTAERVDQTFYRTDKSLKTSLTIKLIADGEWEQVLIFTRTKHGANKLCEKLEKAGISSAAIHGNKSQSARTKALDGFKRNKVRVLVATDIAARGLDIPLLPYVINFELPNIPEDYVHRIGRTGRAGASGDAISLVSEDEVAYVRGIEKLLNQRMEMKEIDGFEASLNYEEPAKKGKSKKSFNRSSPQPGGDKKNSGNFRKNSSRRY